MIEIHNLMPSCVSIQSCKHINRPLSSLFEESIHSFTSLATIEREVYRLLEELKTQDVQDLIFKGFNNETCFLF